MTLDGPVVPRWEWRSIARRLPLDRDRLTIAPGAATASAETYLLSTLTPHNIKVRNAMLEIKRLHQRAPDGLEQWRPTARAAFPLEAAALHELCEAWGLPPASIPAAPSLAVLCQECVTLHPALHRVDLLKRRQRLSFAGCGGELVELEINGERWVSVAFEDADAGVVRAAVVAAGCDVRANLSYPAALKQIRGLPIAVATESEGVR
jgi:hypothetical protein